MAAPETCGSFPPAINCLVGLTEPPASEDERADAREAVAKLLELVSQHFNELYLFGPRFTVADAYLFVMLRWAKEFGVRMSPDLLGYFDRVAEREAVRCALAEEGLA